MKIKDIVKLCGKLLCCGFDEQIFEGSATDDEVRDALSSDKKLSLLTECVSLVETELACDYIPLKAQQCFDSGDAAYSEFEHTPHEIIRVVDQNGADADFKSLPDGVKAEVGGGKMTVFYNYRPAKKGWDDELERGNCKADERLFAYGAIAEYMLLSGMYDEEAVWDKRYKDLAEVVLSTNKSLKIKERRWL